MPSKEAQVKAMFEIGKAEIAGAVTKVPLFWRSIAKAEDKEHFWELWGKENEKTRCQLLYRPGPSDRLHLRGTDGI